MVIFTRRSLGEGGGDYYPSVPYRGQRSGIGANVTLRGSALVAAGVARRGVFFPDLEK